MKRRTCTDPEHRDRNRSHPFLKPERSIPLSRKAAKDKSFRRRMLFQYLKSEKARLSKQGNNNEPK